MSENNKTFKLLYADDNSSIAYTRLIQHVIGDKKKVEVVKIEDVKSKGIFPDLILFTGGEDVDPSYYYENCGKYTSFNHKRDELETNTFNLFPLSVPKLGICRGAQLLTVLSGGRLIQHVEGHHVDHPITLKKYNPGKELVMTSSHHQMLYPFNLNKNKYDLIAYSTYFKSKVYLNGDNKQIELPDDFLEPEIVKYHSTNSLCIQGHPEWMDLKSTTVTYIKTIIKDELFKNNKNLISNENDW